MTKRKAIPQRLAIALAIRAAGGVAKDEVTGEAITWLDALAGKVQIDHDPALDKRPVSHETGDTVPPANDESFLYLRRIDGHKAKTFGPGGEKRITTRGSDVGDHHRDKRVRGSHADHLTYMKTKTAGQKRPRKGTIRSRGFDKRRARA